MAKDFSANPSERPGEIERLDERHVWHPFTQQAEWLRDLRAHPMVISRARGAHLYDNRGRKYIDAVSSLWANLHGHRNPAIDRAVRAQLGRVAHSTFLGLTHEPGARLAHELLEWAPAGLSRVFYSDSGATSVEIALKMAYQYHAQTQASPRTEFLALRESYHGDTIGSVSVGGIDLFHRKFRPLLFKTHFARTPDCSACPQRKKPAGEQKLRFYRYRGESPKPGQLNALTGCRWECLGDVESILRRRGRAIAAAIVEPVVQGASGIRVAAPGYLKGFEALCRRYGVLWIADEVATGFGRTGKMFACEHEGARPDLMCLAKGISGGYLPLAATLATEKIYRAFLGRYDEYKTFFHGHTYTANPLACAAGRASLRIFKRERVLARVQELTAALRRSLDSLASHPRISAMRQAGLMAGIDLAARADGAIPFSPALRVGRRVCLNARRYGLLARPLGDTLVILPPLAIRESDLKRIVRGLAQALEDTLRDPDVRREARAPARP